MQNHCLPIGFATLSVGVFPQCDSLKHSAPSQFHLIEIQQFPKTLQQTNLSGSAALFYFVVFGQVCTSLCKNKNAEMTGNMSVE